MITVTYPCYSMTHAMGTLSSHLQNSDEFTALLNTVCSFTLLCCQYTSRKEQYQSFVKNTPHQQCHVTEHTEQSVSGRFSDFSDASNEITHVSCFNRGETWQQLKRNENKPPKNTCVSWLINVESKASAKLATKLLKIMAIHHPPQWEGRSQYCRLFQELPMDFLIQNVCSSWMKHGWH
jgi:hypothetical protein